MPSAGVFSPRVSSGAAARASRFHFIATAVGVLLAGADVLVIFSTK